MSLEQVNRICPNCKNPNYMVSLGDFSKAYKYKCMNCNRYFNDADFGELLQSDWLTKHTNKKANMVEVVRCKDCKYCEYPDAEREWCKKGHLHRNAKTWFCADGERL